MWCILSSVAKGNGVVKYSSMLFKFFEFLSPTRYNFIHSRTYTRARDRDKNSTYNWYLVLGSG